jgi:hypothetical protein
MKAKEREREKERKKERKKEGEWERKKVERSKATEK